MICNRLSRVYSVSSVTESKLVEAQPLLWLKLISMQVKQMESVAVLLNQFGIPELRYELGEVLLLIESRIEEVKQIGEARPVDNELSRLIYCIIRDNWLCE